MAKLISKRVNNQESDEKSKYRVKNWSSYNRSLVGHMDITLWFDESLAATWHYVGPDQRGSQFVYSDECILGLLELKVIFGLKYRQLEGFAGYLLRLMHLILSIPSYSQICRRASDLVIDIKGPKSKGSIYVVFDSTGLKVFGEGECPPVRPAGKVRKHGYSKRRTWRKLHLGGGIYWFYPCSGTNREWKRRWRFSANERIVRSSQNSNGSD